jgi:hypothetical protein
MNLIQPECLSGIRRSVTAAVFAFFGTYSVVAAQATVPGAPERVVEGQTLISTSVVHVTAQIEDSFVYAGGRRFVLRGHTDVEQHFFVDADDAGNVDRMYWIQFEARLPHNDRPYNYASEERTMIGEYDFVTQVRRYDTEPEEDSDRGAAYRFLEGQGYRVPTPAIRCRFVHIPAGDGRRELMVIYLERNDGTGDVSADEQERLTQRALAGLILDAV